MTSGLSAMNASIYSSVVANRCIFSVSISLHFKEEDSKLLVVTPTKFDAIALIAKSDETDDWPGIEIVLESGKASFQGKLVDSVSIRAARNTTPPKRPAALPDDAIEF
jgi:hypothetical protein